jgi:predicted phosphodiesterase
MPVNATKERLLEVMLYCQAYGELETIEHFKLQPETLPRYKRAAKEQFNIDISENPSHIKKIIERYSEKELAAIAEGGRVIPGQDPVPIVDFSGERIRFGVVGDTHFGSIYTKPEHFFQSIQEFKKEKCEFLVHVGDVTEGMSRRSGHVYELSHIGYEAQRNHSIEFLSQWAKPLYMISGNHDFWYMQNSNTGANIVSDIADNIKNAKYLGHDEGNISLKGKATLRLWHGNDGSSYAISYRLQKIVESYTGGDKPSILVAGHVHKTANFMIRHIQCFGAGCIQMQTKWMRGKRLNADTGFWIIDAYVGKRGVSKITSTWYPFYS